MSTWFITKMVEKLTKITAQLFPSDEQRFRMDRSDILPPISHQKKAGFLIAQSVTYWLGVFVSGSSLESLSSQTPASLSCTPAYTPQRMRDLCSYWTIKRITLWGAVAICACGGWWGDNTHCAVRHSFIAPFSSRHLKAIRKPDSLQQWVKAEEEKHVPHVRKMIY